LPQVSSLENTATAYRAEPRTQKRRGLATPIHVAPDRI
jgi:hypothetical protein